MAQKNNKRKNLFSNVGYLMVLGMGLWAHSAMADVLVVRGVGSVMCPEGYTLTSVSSGENGCDNHWKFNPSVPNSDNNPTSCSSGKAICAKVCN